jgi:transposase-like protein
VSRQQKPSRQVSVDEQIQVVLAVLNGELSPAEAARRHGVSSATVGNWRAGSATRARPGWTVRCPARWWAAPDRAAAAPRVRAAEARSRGGDGAAADLAERLGVRRRFRFADLEALRAAHGVSVSRFAALAGVSERTYWRRRARHRVGDPPKGPWPAPRVDAIEAVAAKYAADWPAWGHRNMLSWRDLR